ncbi:DUF4123 domain-containing protein [Sorangium sp. So ce429]
MRRAILAVQLGPRVGAKAILAPGGRLRVGHKPDADLVIPDRQMSGLHFELSWDGGRCTVRDLGSARGTLLGGEPVETGEVPHGGWIRAGDTDFLVHFEARTPPPLDFERYLDDAEEDEVEPLAARWLAEHREPRRRAAEARALRAEAALRALAARPAPLYAILDAARSDRIQVLLRESVEACRSLYEGPEGDALAHVAPYLVELPRGSALLERIVREGWEKRWGVFIDYPGSFKDLRRHLRRLLMVGDPETRKKYYFRFYDPVVLRAFLPTCSRRQRAETFGEIRAFLAEGPSGELERMGAEGG